MFVYKCVVNPVAYIALLAILISMTWRRMPSWLLWMIALAGIPASALRFLHEMGTDLWGCDIKYFWNAGADIWSGIDPYSPARFSTHPFLNPPSTFPLFALFAAVPARSAICGFALINTVLAFGIVPLARLALDADGEGQKVGLSHAELGAMATAVALSDACKIGITLGQLALLTTTLILLAMYARSRNRPVFAGVMMAMATMKIGTMIPFSLFLLRRKDLKTWAAFGTTLILLIVLGGQPGRILDQCRALLHYIGEMSKTGSLNDISYFGLQNEWIVGIDHLAYRLGIRNGTDLKAIQGGALLLMGVWLAREISSRRISWGPALSLVCLYSAVFLYHRWYDLVIIALPLVYAAGRAKTTANRPQLLYTIAVISIFICLFQKYSIIIDLTRWVRAHRGLQAMFIEWFILPSATWSLLLAMVCIRLAETRRPVGAGHPGERWTHGTHVPAANTSSGVNP